jgi:hypothetical protein
VKNDLSIGVVRLPLASPDLLQLASNFSVVVNLTIENDLERSIRIAHGLIGGRGEIDDREAAMPKAHATIRGDPQPAAIWTSMHHGVPHADQIILSYAEAAVAECKNAVDTAHLRYP